MENSSYRELLAENKELKNELESRVRLFELLSDATNDIVYIIDPDSVIIEVNKRVEDYGYKADELIGRPFSELVPDEFKEIAKQVVIERREKSREVKEGERNQH